MSNNNPKRPLLLVIRFVAGELSVDARIAAGAVVVAFVLGTFF